MALRFEKPDDALMDELAEVKASADELGDVLRKTNWLPDGFERTPLNQMLETLRALPDGTALTAQTALRAARAEIRELQDRYFKTASAIEKLAEYDQQNYLQRRSNFGKSLNQLKGAVDTAITQCAKQSGEAEAADEPPEGERRIDTQQPAAEVASRLESIEQKMRRARADVGDILPPETADIDPLMRILQDTENLSRMTRAVIGLKTASKWVWTGLVTTLKATPQAITVAMKGVKIANDAARPLTQRWNDYQSNLTNFVHDEISATADAVINSMAVIIDGTQATNAPLPPIPEVDDARQEEAERIAETLLKQNKPVPDDVAIDVRVLNLGWSDFSDTALLKNMRYLQYLDSKHTKITTVVPLSTLVYLEDLNLWNTDVIDIIPLIGLKRLTYLDVDKCQIEDLSPLSDLKSLQYLDASNTKVTNWWPVEHVETVHGRPYNWRDLPQP